MPHNAAQKAEQLEREAEDATAEIHLEDAVGLLGEALAIREASVPGGGSRSDLELL